MLRGDLLVKTADVEIEIPVAVKRQNPFRFSWRYSLPPPHRSIADSQNLGGLPPAVLRLERLPLAGQKRPTRVLTTSTGPKLDDFRKLA